MNSTLCINVGFFCLFFSFSSKLTFKLDAKWPYVEDGGSEASCLMMKSCSALELHDNLGNVGQDKGHRKGKENSRSSRTARQAGHADVCRGSLVEKEVCVAGTENGKVKKSLHLDCNEPEAFSCSRKVQNLNVKKWS